MAIGPGMINNIIITIGPIFLFTILGQLEFAVVVGERLLPSISLSTQLSCVWLSLLEFGCDNLALETDGPVSYFIFEKWKVLIGRNLETCQFQ